MNIKIDDPLLIAIGDLADELNLEVYVVGGWVRDFVMGRSRTDIDCTVVGDACAFAEKFAERVQSHAVIYERFRTAMVPVKGNNIEFVGTRKEEYVEHSRKPVVSEGTLYDDLARRDFTSNSLACSLNKSSLGFVVDEFDGLRAIEKKQLVTPKNPHITFSDDPLRMMRAARFASQLDFTIEENALEAMKQMCKRISIISQERITAEFLKIMESPRPSVGLDILYKTGLLEIVFPEVFRLAGIDLATVGMRQYSHKDVFYHTLKVVDNVASVSNDVWLRFAALMHDIAKPKTKKFSQGIGWSFHGHEDLGAKWQSKIFKRMKMPLEFLPKVETLVRLHQRPMVLVDDGVTDSAVRRLAVAAGDWLEDLFILCKADITTQNESRAKKYLHNYNIVYNKIVDVRERDQLAAFQSPVRGEEIMQLCGLSPSRAVGVIKNALEEAILDGIIPNDYNATREYLLANKDELLELAQRSNSTSKGIDKND